jgi:predicted acyl esterase
VLTYATGVNKWEVSQQWPVGTPTPFYLAAARLRRSQRCDQRAGRLCSRPGKPGAVHPAADQHGRRQPVEAVAVRDQRFVEAVPTC